MKKGAVAILSVISCCIILYLIRYNEISKIDTSQNEAEKIILTVLAGQSTTDAGIEDMITEAISEKFPEVILEWECVDWGESFDKQLQIRLAAGDIPDIIVGKAQDVYPCALRGILSPISPDCYKYIDQQALDAVSMDGIVYGIPYNSLYQGVIYNKKIFEQFNLTPPATREELDEIVTILENNDITPFAAHFMEAWQVGNTTMQFFANDIFRDNPGWGDDFRSGMVNFQDNELIKDCILQNQYILDHSWEDALDIDQYECDIRFIKGMAAMYLTGSWSLQTVNNAQNEKSYGIFPYPNKEGDSYLIHETNMTFMKSKASIHPNLIDKILTELVTNSELIYDILDFTQSYPVIKNISLKQKYCIDDDVAKYKDKNHIIEITSDNNQLIWSFQNDLAMKQLEWLRGELPIEKVLEYADSKRQDSSY